MSEVEAGSASELHYVARQIADHEAAPFEETRAFFLRAYEVVEARVECIAPGESGRHRGGERNRTAVRGFAGPCLNHSATPPARRRRITFTLPAPRRSVTVIAGSQEEQVTALAHSIGNRTTRSAAWTWDVGLIVAGTLFIYLLTQVAIPLEPFSPVPISGQTLGVLAVGGALGAWRAGTSVLLYLALGAAGVPSAFAEGRTGMDLLKASSPTGGYLIGFLIAAVVVGYLCQRGWDRSIRSSLGAMLIGEIVIFAIGVPWLANAIGVPATEAMELGLYPFVIGDLIKLFLAAGLLPVTWKLLGSEKTDRSSS